MPLPSKTLFVHLGLQPGELLLSTKVAQNSGVVVVPPATHPTRFEVEQTSGPSFQLVRVASLPWPQPPERQQLFQFEHHADAQQSLVDLEEALMLEQDVDPAPSPPAPSPSAVFSRWPVVMLVSLVAGVLGLGLGLILR